MSRWQFRIAPYLRPERRHIAVLALLAAFGVAIEALLPWPLKLVIDNALAGAPLPEGAHWIGALPGAQSADGLLAWLAFSVLLLFLGVQLVALMRGVLEAGLSARLRCALGATLFDHLQRLSLIYHRRAAKGDLMRRVTEDTDCLPALITAVALPIFTAILSLVVLFVIMWKLHPMLTVVAALVVVPMALLMRLLGPQMSNRAYEHQQAEGKIWSVAEQTLTALPVVQAFGRETEEQSRFRGVAAQSIRAYLRTLTAQLQFRVGIDGSQAIGMAAIMIIGGWHVLAGSLSLGTLVVFLGYLTLLYAPLLSLAYLAPTLAAAAGSARRVEEVLDAPLTVIDATNARPLGGQQPGGHVRLKGVVFGYEPDRPVLRGVDFEARPGELVSLVGATGAGKSTLVSLIPRLFDPWEGSVTIDDQDLRTATISSVRESVAFVLQDSFLLPSSIADNIAYGRPSATRAEIETAARLAGAEGFIRELPQGLDTVIGERGSTLSGGQRQRIAIARAFLKDAPILIMDEPTSALDVATENEVLDAMARLAIGRTTIVIAHRLSTIRRADRVVVLDHGMVAESGTHEELMAGNGLYRRLYGSTEQPTANLDSDRSGIRG